MYFFVKSSGLAVQRSGHNIMFLVKNDKNSHRIILKTWPVLGLLIPVIVCTAVVMSQHKEATTVTGSIRSMRYLKKKI